MSAGDPGVLISEAPGLNGLAGGEFEASLRDLRINMRLRLERSGRRVFETHIDFGELDFEAECGEALQIFSERREGCGVVEGRCDVQLEADAVERYAALLEVGRHSVDGVRLRVH